MTFEEIMKSIPDANTWMGLYSIFWLAEQASMETLDDLKSKFGTYGFEKMAELLDTFKKDY